MQRLSWRALCLLITLASCWACALPPSPPPARQLSAGHFLLDSALTTPPRLDDPRWVEVALPDAWRSSRPELGGRGWYRFEVRGRVTSTERWALFLPAVNMTANAYVNGQSVGSGGSIEPPVAHNFYRPLYFVFPGSLLDGDVNRIDVELGAIPHHFGNLSPLWLGPDAVLAPTFSRLYFERVTLSWLESFLGLVMAALMAALWRSSRDRTYGSFALVSLFWAISSLNYWVRDPPVSHWTWERLIHLSLFAFGVSLAVWCHRLLAIERPRVVRGMLVAAVLVGVVIVLLPPSAFYPTVNFVHLLTLGASGYAYVTLLMRLGQLSAGERFTYVFGGLLNIGFGVHDLGIMFGWLPQGSPYLLSHSAPILVILFGTSLTRRFARSLEAAERLNRNMEQLVREKHAELEENYQRVAQLERERVLSDERHRMIREMHDGLGSQLTSTLALIERGGADRERLTVALRGALDEMRLVIDSLDSEPRQLHEVLGVLRARLQPILRAAGLVVDWRTDEGGDGRNFSAQESLHLLRIVQEAIGNAIKHARATRIEVSLAGPEASAAELRLTISDDGCGIDPGSGGSGRGLAHMRYRARALGAELCVSSDGSGTRVELRLPDAAPRQSVRTMPRETASNTASERERTSSLR